MQVSISARRRTGLHEVAVKRLCLVRKDLGDDQVILGSVTINKAVARPACTVSSVVCSACTVIVGVGGLDPLVDKEPERIGGQVQRQDSEVNHVVAIQHVFS